MKLQLVFLAIFGKSLLHSALGVMNRDCPCITPQHIEYGKRGTIACNFTGDIDVIHWYNTSDTLHNPPVISWNKESEGAMGYARGGYDIQPNGSLLINETISKGDGYFKVVMLSNELIVCEKIIHVIVFEKPHQSSYLAIDKCDSKRYCHKRVDSDETLQLNCHLIGAVVSRKVVWELWTFGEPQTIRSAERTIAGGVGEDTNVSLILPFTDQRLDVLVCKTEENLAYEMKSSTILVEWTCNNSNTQYATITPINKMAKLKSKFRLDCGGSKRISFVWKMCHSENKYDCVEIMHFALENKVFFEKGFSADNAGTLLVEEVNIHHEGWYLCYSSNGRNNTERFYRVDVYAMPVPLKPIVAECDDKHLCQIDSGLKGNITCSLFGVRPEARLEWVVISVTSSKIISLEKKEQTVTSHEGVYDISIKTLYHVESLQFSKIELECRANMNITMNITLPSRLSTKVLLHLSDLNTSGVENHQSPSGVWRVTTLGILLLASFAVFICITKNFYNGRRDASNQFDEEEPMNILRNTNEREHLEENFRIRLSTLKVNIARNLSVEDALLLSSMFTLDEEEQKAVSSSKNPAVALIDVLLNGDDMTVKYNLSELERISKNCDMTEVNQLLNSFIRSRFREAFLLKVNLMKNGKVAKEEKELFHKLLWDYSKLKTISDLEAFFDENYSTTISSVQEGSLNLWLKMPPTELLDNLWTDIQSGMLTTKICPIIIENVELEYSHGNTFELKVSCDTNVEKRIKKMINHAAKGKRNDDNNQYKSNINRYGKAATSDSSKTVLTEMVATMSFQMANFIGSAEASDLCKYFELSHELSEQMLLSPNPGLEVIIRLIKKDQKSLESIANDLNDAACELSCQEVSNILHNFKRSICKNQEDNFENRRFSQNHVIYVARQAIAQFWWPFVKFFLSGLCKFIGWDYSSVPLLNRDKKTIPISKGSVELTERTETQNDEKRDDSDLNLRSMRQLFNEITSEMKIVECQQPFNEYDVFLLNLAVKSIDEWKENCNVDINKTCSTRIATVITIVFGLLLSPFLSKTGFDAIWTLLCLTLTILLFSPFISRSIHIEGIKAMQMNLSPLLIKLITIIRTVDEIAIIVVKASLINDKLDTLSQLYTTKQLSDQKCYLKDQLELMKQQKYQHSTSLVETVQETFQIIKAAYDVIENFYSTVNDDQTEISSDILNLNDAISYITNNANVFPPSLLHFLLPFYGIADGSYYKSDRSIKDNLIPRVEYPWKQSSGRQNLSLQSLTTSMVAKAIPQASLQDRSTTEISSVVARNGIILKNSGIFISFGHIGRKVVALCEDFGVEPSFVFEQLQHQMLALQEICMSAYTL